VPCLLSRVAGPEVRPDRSVREALGARARAPAAEVVAPAVDGARNRARRGRRPARFDLSASGRRTRVWAATFQIHGHQMSAMNDTVEEAQWDATSRGGLLG